MNQKTKWMFCLFIIFVLFPVALVFPNKGQSQMNINSLEKITLGNVEQWILIKGENISNPILLFLHGGPGFPQIPFTHIDSDSLEKYFVVVNWDQRGAGKSYNEAIPLETMNASVQSNLDSFGTGIKRHFLLY